MTPLFIILEDHQGRLFKAEISQDDYLEITITHNPGYLFGENDPPESWQRVSDEDETTVYIRCRTITLSQVDKLSETVWLNND